MGYCIELNKANFCIRADRAEEALRAAKQLGNGSNDPRAHGGTYPPESSSTRPQRWFAWMNDTYPEQWATIGDALDAWRFPVKMDAEGNWGEMDFSGEKIGDEIILFEVLAPYVEKGSTIQMYGEDGARWTWVFDGESVEEKEGWV